MSPKANLTLRSVSVSEFVGTGAALAVFGAILLLVAICLIIGAQNVTLSQYYQIYDPSPRKNIYWDNTVKPPRPISTPGISFPEM